MEIYPSLISSDLLNLEKTIKLLEPHCHGFHIDIMDDHFVPNLTWGHGFVNSIAKATKQPLHVHLMVDNPESWINRLALRSTDCFIFHIEASKTKSETMMLIEAVHDARHPVGIAVNPATNIELIHEYLPLLQIVLIMSVQPGFSGQKFMPEVVHKVPELVALRKKLNAQFKICMDGGIGTNNIATLAEMGVDQVGAAASIFAQPDPKTALLELYRLVG